MVQAKALEKSHERSVGALSGIKVGAGVISFLLIAGFIFLALYQQRPPATVSASASPLEFSSERAFKYVQSIAQRPHPIGSAEHEAVRERIVGELVALGFSPEVQKTSVVSQRRNSPFLAGTVENILVRLKGTDSTKAVMLVGHYDSVPTAPGASDDGSGVAAIFETLRALKAGSPLKNDVIALFTDGEEAGLLGAKAFVDDHAWAKDVGLALNFEARGSSGAGLMFETSSGNNWLIKEFAGAVANPVIANSLLTEAYKILPNDTDLTEFKKAGLNGLNFAFINEPTHYHTQLDNIANMDQRSLQHQGAYALSLTRRFSNLDLRNQSRSDAVYFDVLGSKVVHYPLSWVLPFAVFIILLFAAVTVIGIRKQQLKLTTILLGALLFLLDALVVWLAVSVIWWAVRALHSNYKVMPFGETYNSNLYLISFVALTIAVTTSLFVLIRRRISEQNLWMGVMLCWIILTLVTSLFYPGASYLFFWPLLFGLIALGVTFVLKDQRPASVPRMIVLLVGVLPGIILLSPMIKLLFTGLSVSASAYVMILVALLLGLLIPHLNFMTASKRWLLPGAMLTLCVGFIVAGSLNSAASAQHPAPNSIFYALNADTGQAFWASSDDLPDSWTTQFFTKDPKQIPMKDFFPFSRSSFLVGSASAIALPAPEVSVIGDEQNNGVRLLRIRVNSPRRASLISIYLDSNVEVQSAVANGKPIKGNVAQSGTSAPWGLRYYALPPEGLELNLAVKSPSSFNMKVVDQTYGLPVVELEPHTQRPDNMIPSSNPFSDTTQVSKSFKF